MMFVQMKYFEQGPKFYSTPGGWGTLVKADRLVEDLPIPSNQTHFFIPLEQAEALVDADLGGVSVFTGEFIY